MTTKNRIEALHKYRHAILRLGNIGFHIFWCYKKYSDQNYNFITDKERTKCQLFFCVESSFFVTLLFNFEIQRTDPSEK